MQQNQYRENQNQSRKNKRFLLLLQIGLGVSGTAVLVAGGVQVARLQTEESRVGRITGYFNCVCEMQCSLTWATCICNKPDGALEGRNYIREGLKKGLSDEEIVVLASQKYGGLNLLNQQE